MRNTKMKQSTITVAKAKPAQAKKISRSDLEFLEGFRRSLDDIRAGRVTRLR